MNRLQSFLPLFIVACSFVPMDGLLAQDQTDSSSFSVTGYAGAAWNGSKEIPFRPLFLGGFGLSIHPGPAFGLGLEYGPLYQLAGTSVCASIEVAFGQEGGSITSGNSTYTARIQRIPILFWLRLIADTRLSPFIRGGIGTASTHLLYTVEQSATGSLGMDFSQWHWIWALGAGLAFHATSEVAFELFVDDWLTESDVVSMTPGFGVDGIEGRNSLTVLAVRLSLAL